MKSAEVILAVWLTLFGVRSQNFEGGQADGKINFESEEEEGYPDVTTPALEAVVDLTNFQDPRPQGHSHAELPPRTSNFGTRQRAVVGRTRDLKKRRRNFYQDNSNANGRTTVVNNIQIVVNGNETEPSDDCQTGVCNVCVTSRPDDEGNIITDVRLTIITNPNSDAKPKVEVNEVPVINGYRGAENSNDVLPPEFHFVDKPRPNPSDFYYPRNDIPLTRMPNYFNNAGTWYRNNQRPYVRPPLTFRYDLQRPKYDFRPHRPWQPPRSFVDDKIEPPLSKTKLNGD